MSIKLWTIELNRIYMDSIETIILPSLPAIALYFMVPNFIAQLMIPAFLAGKLFTKFVILTDIAEKYDKKKILISFLWLSLIGSLLALLPSIKWMLIGRTIQGAGIGCVTSISTALVKEISKDDFIGSWSKIGLLNVWTPLIATLIGGVLQTTLGWQSNFIFLFLFGCLIIFLSIKFIPSFPPSEKKEKLNYQAFLKPSMLCMIIAYSLIYAGQAVIYTITPILFIQKYHWKPHYYWIILLCFVAGMFFAKLVIKRLQYLLGNFLIKFGVIGLAVLSCLTLAYTEQLNQNTAYIVLALIAVYGFAQSILSITSRDDIQKKFPSHVSTGAAFMGIFQSLTGTLFSFITARYFHHEPKDLGIILLGVSLSALAVLLISYRKPQETNAD